MCLLDLKCLLFLFILISILYFFRVFFGLLWTKNNNHFECFPLPDWSIDSIICKRVWDFCNYSVWFLNISSFYIKLYDSDLDFSWHFGIPVSILILKMHFNFNYFDKYMTVTVQPARVQNLINIIFHPVIDCGTFDSWICSCFISSWWLCLYLRNCSSSK